MPTWSIIMIVIAAILIVFTICGTMSAMVIAGREDEAMERQYAERLKKEENINE